MVIKSLKLKNYRNYDLLDLTFDPKTNILYGDNAQGKTNILEALYLSGTTKSHRGTKDRDMIQFGYDESHLETVVEKKGIIFQKTVRRELQSIRYRFAVQVSYSVLSILFSFLQRILILSKRVRQEEEDLLILSFPSLIRSI